MRMQFSSTRNTALLAVSCALVFTALTAQRNYSGNQENGSASIAAEKNANTTIAVKQEIDPQAAARIGDRMTVATPPNQGKSKAAQRSSSAASHQESGVAGHGPRKDSVGVAKPTSDGSKSKSLKGSTPAFDRDGNPQQNMANAIDPDGRPQFFNMALLSQSSR
ncbi:MAG TPA: hypothetical protein VGG45_14125 [Terracidiphilus sp.]|jgi:hypothetical protein